MMDDVQALKPTVFCGVPRVYDKLYAGNTFDQVENSSLVSFCWLFIELFSILYGCRYNAKNLS